jgi:hypothetical protein
MNKREYFLAAMNAECYRHRGWVHDAFSFQEETEGTPHVDFPYPLWRDGSGYHILNTATGQVEHLEGVIDDEEPFGFHDEIKLKKGEVPNLMEDVTTTYGNVLLNYCTLVYSVGSKIPFQIGQIKPGKLEQMFYHMHDTPDEGAKRAPDVIYADEYQKFQDGVRYVEEFADLCVPAATPFNVMTDPKIAEVRAKLIEQNKDKLNDPAVEAKITAELVKMDKAWIDQDPEKGFYQKEKSFNVTRKKMFLIQGTEAGFEASPEANIIENSLEDGWDITRLPEMNNSLRNGSFSRGAQTALAGEIVKTLLRITQNTSISEDDCHAKFGLPVLITQENFARYVDRYFFNPSKKATYIDEKTAKSLIGKQVDMRSSWSCQTDGYNVCRTCMGKEMGETPKAIGVYVSDVGSALLTTFLKIMHGQSRSARKYHMHSAIT